MRAVVFAVLTFVTVSAHAESVRPRLVITKIAAPQTLEGAGDAIFSEVRSSIESTGLFRIVKQDAVHTMALVSPSAACPQVSCAARLGRLTEADVVLLGEVSDHEGSVSVALRLYDVRDGSITRRLAFDVSTRREDLARDVDAAVRSMLGLSVRRSPTARHERIELALN